MLPPGRFADRTAPRLSAVPAMVVATPHATVMSPLKTNARQEAEAFFQVKFSAW